MGNSKLEAWPRDISRAAASGSRTDEFEDWAPLIEEKSRIKPDVRWSAPKYSSSLTTNIAFLASDLAKVGTGAELNGNGGECIPLQHCACYLMPLA